MANCTANGIEFSALKRPVPEVIVDGGEVCSSGARLDPTDASPTGARCCGHDSEIPQEEGQAMIRARQYLALSPERHALVFEQAVRNCISGPIVLAFGMQRKKIAGSA
jgi:hypothetical protein